MQKLVFAHQLRAIAALCVLSAHYLGVFWSSTTGITNHIGVPKIDTALSLSGSFYFSHYAIFLGEFGVGIFFIISGFVIPFSLKNRTFRQFAIERLYRIFPVYWIGFSITILAMILAVTFWGGSFKFSLWETIVHYFLIFREWFSFPKIDNISWTLEIELKFYLLCAVFFMVLKERPLLLLYLSLAILSTLSVISLLYFYQTGWYFSRQLIMMILMFSGVSLFFLHNKLILLKDAVIFLTINSVCFLVLLQYHYLTRTISWQFFWGFFAAIITFLACYYGKKHFKSSPLLDHFANISYPLYVVHAWTGYVLLYSVLKWGYGSWIAVFLAITVVYILSVAIHYLVEKPAIAKGREVGARFAQKPVTG